MNAFRGLLEPHVFIRSFERYVNTFLMIKFYCYNLYINKLILFQPLYRYSTVILEKYPNSIKSAGENLNLKLLCCRIYFFQKIRSTIFLVFNFPKKRPREIFKGFK